MATTVAIPPAKAVGIGARIVSIIPGLLLLAAVGYAGKFIEQSIAHYTKAKHITFPNIEYVLWAIIIGLVIENTVGVPKVFQAGRRHLRILAQGRNRAVRLTLPAR